MAKKTHLQSFTFRLIGVKFIMKTIKKLINFLFREKREHIQLGYYREEQTVDDAS